MAVDFLEYYSGERFAFAAQGKVKADIELQPLSSINDVPDAAINLLAT